MPWPKGLLFRQRRADLEGRFFFDCTRTGHPPGQRRVKRAFATHAAREIYITRHDARCHDDLLAQTLGIQRGPSLAEAVGDFMQHLRKLQTEGKRDPKTIHYYEGICRKLIAVFGGEARLETITRRAMLIFAEEEKKNGSTSRGDRFVKAAKVVKRLQKFCEVGRNWDLPTDDLSPERDTRESIPLADIRDFLRAMPRGSLEHTFAITKLITMLRNEELYAANVGDLRRGKDGTGELDYWLRNKQGDRIRHVTFIPAVLMAALEPLLDRPADRPLFEIGGKRPRRLTAWSLRKRFERASARATAKRRKRRKDAPAVDIKAIGQFRHEAATVAMDELGKVGPVTEHLHHADERTTRKHYKLPKRAVTLKNSRRVTEVTSKLVN